MLFTSFASAEIVLLENDLVRREFGLVEGTWRTVAFSRADGTDRIDVDSDEFHFRGMDDGEVSARDYVSGGDPVLEHVGKVQRLTLTYTAKRGGPLPENMPRTVRAVYTLADNTPYLRKTLYLGMNQGDALDRIEVERFVTAQQAERGGRGEPLFVGDNWFFGVEFPAAYSRRGDGNQPEAYSGPYDRVGNYSFIDLDGRDIEAQPRAGLVRLFHFPGPARAQDNGTWGIVSKTAVCGVGAPGDPMELVFLDYLDTIRRPVRSFIHYNNWYDPGGKDLRKETFVDKVYAAFAKNLSPYGVTIDAMVPDNGWQNKATVYQPSAAHFPNGDADFAALGEALREAGTGLGLWMSLNSYTSKTAVLAEAGYPAAVVNKHFSRFKTITSLASPAYYAAIHARLGELVALGQLTYIKHDFNTLCDMGPDNDSLPTDRHGHERAVERELELLALEREVNPAIYQNVTNWIWFSPWWLAHGNNLWMLSGDKGVNRQWPQISTRKMAITYRDYYIERCWGDPELRPLVPISHLMTHGILHADRAPGDGPGDTLEDWADYVVMYYGRGLQLKEWYITPARMTPERWKVLGRATRWSEEHVETLANSVYVGGEAARGEAYGYMCWNGDAGILTCRNPSPQSQVLRVPFDKAIAHYRGETGKAFQAEVIHPYRGAYPGQFVSGEAIEIRIPGYSTLVLHFAPGPDANAAPQEIEAWKPAAPGLVVLPKDMKRCDALITLYDADAEACRILVNDTPIVPHRRNAGKLDGGPAWSMLAVDLLPYAGQEVRVEVAYDGPTRKFTELEAWLIADVASGESTPESPVLPWAVNDGYRRWTVALRERGAAEN